MKEIQAEGIKFIYLRKGDTLPDKAVVSEAPFVYANWDELLSNNFHDMRLILFTYPFRPHVQYVRFLHWNDGSDLDELDEKVEQRMYSDADFENSVITGFGRTFCLKCDWIKYTLVMWTAEYYFGEMERRKIREHLWKTHCPNCGAVLSQLVAKIF
jgi:hypothetical protein